jgi:hypothetical protein
VETGANQSQGGFSMDIIIWIVLACIWIALAFWPARVADRKGHSFFGYFVLSLFFFPLSLVMAYMVRDNRGLAAS